MAIPDPKNSLETPSIAALPQPTETERLKSQNEALGAEVARLTAELSETKAALEKSNAAGLELQTKLEELERNPFTFMLSNMDAGAVLAELAEEFTGLCETVKQRAKKGTLTLTLGVKPFKADGLIFTHAVKVSAPKPDPIQSVFYLTGNGLSRNDPSQAEFRFGTPPAPSRNPSDDDYRDDDREARRRF